MFSTHKNPKDRQEARRWARELFTQKFYIIDTETTGIGKADEVVQIGVVNQDGDAVINTLVKPTRPCSAGATRVHGITSAMLQDAPTFSDIYVMLSAKLAGAQLIAYNMDFDWRLLLQTAKVHRLPMFRTGQRACAMKMYAQYRGVWNGRFGNYRWHKLAQAAAFEQITVKDAHNALGDARMTLGLLQKMAE